MGVQRISIIPPGGSGVVVMGRDPYEGILNKGPAQERNLFADSYGLRNQEN